MFAVNNAAGQNAFLACCRADGFSKSDEVLMGKKAEFLREVPPHLNVVRFIGELEDTGGEGPSNVSH